MKPPREAPFPRESGAGSLQEACVRRVKDEWGGYCLNVHGSPSQERGHPDLLICLRGYFVACELKQPGKDATPLQKKRLRSWAAAGAVVGVVHTEVELDELLARVPA